MQLIDLDPEQLAFSRMITTRNEYEVKDQIFHLNQEKLNRACPFFNVDYDGNRQWKYTYNLLQLNCHRLKNENNKLHKRADYCIKKEKIDTENAFNKYQ